MVLFEPSETSKTGWSLLGDVSVGHVHIGFVGFVSMIPVLFGS